MIDLHGRTIDYMRISITDRCNLRCRYCMPEDVPFISHEEILRFEEILRICRLAATLGIRKFKVTGGEPFVRKDCILFLRALKSLPGVEQVTLTTNGILLSDYLEDLKDMGIDGINISLDTLRADTFEHLTGRRELSRVLESVTACQASGIRTKINSVLLQGINEEDFFQLVELAKRDSIDVRFIEIMPIGYGKQYQGRSCQELMSLLDTRYPGYLPVRSPRGNGPATYIRLPGFSGCIGFIDAIHGKFCSSCNRVRLTSDGLLKLCLYYQNGIDLKTMLRRGDTDEVIRAALADAVRKKPEGHQFYQHACEGQEELRRMSQIGG